MNDTHESGEFPSAADFLESLNREAGWPPRFPPAPIKQNADGTPPQQLKNGKTGIGFNTSMRRARVQTAIRSPNVRAQLTGRWSILGVHCIAEYDHPCGEDECIRVCIFNYSNSVLTNVFLINGAVSQVLTGPVHGHPESAQEIAQAIAIARHHPELAEFVKGLQGHGILRVPTRRESIAYGHRCIDVAFTQPDDRHKEQRVLYSASVDLTLQQVVGLGCTDCHAETQR